jgi:benzoate-CoA ligase
MNGQHTDQSMPTKEIPRVYNAAHDLLSRHSQRPNKIAYIEASTNKKLSYAELAHQAHCFAQALIDTGFEQEQRILVCMHDGLHWPVVFLGCILAGVVPIAVNTLLTAKDYEYMLRDSRAKGLIVSSALWPQFENILPLVPTCQHIFIDEDAPRHPAQSVSQCIHNTQPLSECVHTLTDDGVFGCTPVVLQVRPKELCICTATSSKRPNYTDVGYWDCKKTMWCFLRRNCFSPMDWAMP